MPDARNMLGTARSVGPLALAAPPDPARRTPSATEARASEAGIDTTQVASFDAALASFLGSSASIPSIPSPVLAIERQSRAEAASKGADSARVKGAEEEAQREVKNAAEADVAQNAADKLAAPATQGAVAQADASELENTPAQPSRSSHSPLGQTSHAGAVNDADGDELAGPTSSLGAKPAASPSPPASANSSASKSQAADAGRDASASSPGSTPTNGSINIIANAPTPGAISAATAASQAKPATIPTQSTVNAVGGVQGSRSTAFRKLLEQGQPARRSTEQRHVAQSVAKGLQMLVREGGGEVLLKLKPVELGAVTARLSIQDARVDATFHAQTPLARDLLVSSMQELKAALETRGLIVDRVEVVLEDSALDNRNQTRGQIAGSDEPHARTVGDGRTEGAQGRSPDKDNTRAGSNESPQASSDQGAMRFSSDSRSGQDGSRAAWMPTTGLEGGGRIAEAGEAATEPIWSFSRAGGGGGGRVADGFEWVA